MPRPRGYGVAGETGDYRSRSSHSPLRKLRTLNQARTLADLRVPPGNRLEGLKGDRRGQYSIRFNRQWRICFRWQEGTAQDVAIVDDHD